MPYSSQVGASVSRAVSVAKLDEVLNAEPLSCRGAHEHDGAAHEAVHHESSQDPCFARGSLAKLMEFVLKACTGPAGPKASMRLVTAHRD